MRFRSLILLMMLTAAPHLHAKSKCFSLLGKLGGMVLDKSLLIATAAGGLVAGQEAVGILEQSPHLGLSIYFDYDTILGQFTASEQQLIKNAKTDPEKAVSLLVARLALKSGDSFDVWPYLKPLMASQFFSENPPPTNVCRHKALILNALLNHVGIRSQLITGTIQGDSGRGSHVWIYLPDSRKVADPMNGIYVDRNKYQALFQAEESIGVMQFPKLVGIMAR